MPFQQSVNLQLAPAVEGDFSSCNPRSTVQAGPGEIVAGSTGVSVGQFAWTNSSGVAKSAWQTGGQFGFVHREQQALITTFLAETSNLIPPGFPVTLHRSGDFWDKFVGGAAIGQKVYTYYADGTAYAAATATPPTMTGAVTTATDTSLVVTTAPSSPIAPGMPVSGTGIAAGSYVVSGPAAGGLGTYVLSAATTASAAGVTATFTTAVETAWRVDSTAAAGELAKISA